MFGWFGRKLGTTGDPSRRGTPIAKPILELIDDAQVIHGDDLDSIGMSRTTEMVLRRAIANKLGMEIRQAPDFRKGGTYDGLLIVMDDTLEEGEVQFCKADGKDLEI